MNAQQVYHGGPPPMYPPPPNPHMMMMQQQPQQPQVVNQTQVVVSQPGAPTKARDWDTGKCGCCDDCGICWLVLFFSPCFLCYLSAKMKEGCIMPIWVCPFTIALMALRIKLRSKHNIKGSICKDYCVSNCVCCAACVLCQLARQYNILKRNKGAAV